MPATALSDPSHATARQRRERKWPSGNSRRTKTPTIVISASQVQLTTQPANTAPGSAVSRPTIPKSEYSDISAWVPAMTPTLSNSEQIAAHGVERDLIAQARAEVIERSRSVVPRAVEAPIDRVLHPPPQWLEQRK